MLVPALAAFSHGTEGSTTGDSPDEFDFADPSKESAQATAVCQCRSIDVVPATTNGVLLGGGGGERFIAECRRVLKPGGILRIVVPDLRRIVKEYESGQIESRDFLVALGAHAPWAGTGKARQIAALFSGSAHLCMYGEEALLRLIPSHGFDCHRGAPFESVIEDIRVIEREDRAIDELIVEGTSTP